MSRVRRILVDGGVIAYPAEGVWGLGCDPFQQEAVVRLLALKKRAVDRGLILVAGEIHQIETLLPGPGSAQREELEKAWPGPVTYLVPDRGRVPRWIRGSNPAVALRVSDHPVVQRICREFGGPIVSTSANSAGHAPALTSLRVRHIFPRGIDLIVPGEVGESPGPTEIRDLVSGRIVRAA